MGSGKGITRRASSGSQLKAQTSAPVAHRDSVHFSSETWRKFIGDNGLAKIGMQKYYLGAAKPQIGREDCAKLLTELFNDAVEVGALTYPGDLKAEDFRIQIKSDLGSLTNFIGHAQITVKGDKEAKGTFVFNPRTLRYRSDLSSQWTESMLISIGSGLLDLFF